MTITKALLMRITSQLYLFVVTI